MENAIIALRNKFADDIEEILQCPVCFETLCGTVPMCTQGHHVCIKCQPHMAFCPFCKSLFNGTRNYLAENLISKFDEIKISLIDPKHQLNKTVLQNVVCVQTQTDSSINTDMVTDSAPLVNEPNKTAKELDIRVAPAVGKGKYPCRIGSCPEELPHGRMLPHIRYYHNADLMEEQQATNDCYTQSWTLQYKFPDEFNRAINISNMGFFFLNIYVNNAGALYGNLQIVNTRLIAQQFQYELEVTNNQSSTGYKGMVMACRTAKSKLNEKCLFVNHLFMEHILKKKQMFTCNLILRRLPESDCSLKKSKSSSSLAMEP